MKTTIKKILATLALLMLAGCWLKSPKQDFQAIGDSSVIVKHDLDWLLVNEKDPMARPVIQDAEANLAKIPTANENAQRDYGDLLKKYNSVIGGWGYRLQVACTVGFWGIILLVAGGIVFLIIFPAFTPILMNFGGFFGGLIQHISAALPLQNLKLVAASLTGKRIVAIPKMAPNITVTAAGAK